ncbi:MAG: hypothetical protein ABIT09_11510 [Croceibacterium sp.]
MAETKRTQIKRKVEAGEKRNADHSSDNGRTTIVDRAGERTLEAKDRFFAFAKDHPLAAVAGGLAIGVLISSAFRGSPTRKMGKHASKLANVGAELAMAYAAQALAATEPARKDAAEKLGELGDAALKYGKSGGDTAQEVARTAGKRIARAIHGRFN